MARKLKKETVRDIRIVILNQGWVLVGLWSCEGGDSFRVDNGYVIRIWGTKAGIGELALLGPQEATILDPITVVHYDVRNEVANLECYSAAWEKLC